MDKKWSGAIQVASVYVGTVVGAGFATGKEIVQFFTQYGFYGLVSIFVSGCLFMFLGVKMMLIAAKIKATSYKQLSQYLFGKRASKFVNITLLVMLFGVSAVMLSGAGALFNEQLLLPRFAGILITIALVGIVMAVGMKGILVVNVFIVPMMVLFSIMLLILTVKLPGFTETIFTSEERSFSWGPIVSPFSYVAFNLAVAQAVLVPVASKINDRKIIIRGGILGGAILTIILLASHLTLIMLPNLHLYDVPMAVIMKNLAKDFYAIYILIIFGEIFTSIIGNVFGLERKLYSMFYWHRSVSFSLIFVVIIIVSQINYSQLLSFLYPLFGYLSLIFIILLFLRE